MQRFVDLETGEIIDVVPFRRAQARLVRQARPVWQIRKAQARRNAWGTWVMKLMAHFGPMVVLGLVAGVILILGK